MTRRILAITIAIVLAALGTAGGLFLVLSAESRAQTRISDPVTVAIATKRIPIGTTGAQDPVGRHGPAREDAQGLVPTDAMSEIERRARQAGGHLEHRGRPGAARGATSANASTVDQWTAAAGGEDGGDRRDRGAGAGGRLRPGRVPGGDLPHLHGGASRTARRPASSAPGCCCRGSRCWPSARTSEPGTQYATTAHGRDPVSLLLTVAVNQARGRAAHRGTQPRHALPRSAHRLGRGQHRRRAWTIPMAAAAPRRCSGSIAALTTLGRVRRRFDMTILYEPHRRDAQQFAVLLGSDVHTAATAADLAAMLAPEPGRAAGRARPGRRARRRARDRGRVPGDPAGDGRHPRSGTGSTWACSARRSGPACARWSPPTTRPACSPRAPGRWRSPGRWRRRARAAPGAGGASSTPGSSPSSRPRAAAARRRWRPTSRWRWPPAAPAGSA